MSAYNAQAFLREAVDSILAQTFDDFELIVVDDASSDETPRILAEYSDPRIRILRNSTNLGVGGARNKGLSIARGKYIAIHDADDTSIPDRFALQVDYLNAHPDVGLVGSTAFYVNTPSTLAAAFPEVRNFCYPDTAPESDEKNLREFDTNWLTLPNSQFPTALVTSPLSDLAITWTLLLHNAFCTTTTMFRRSLFDALGGYSELPEHRYCEDYAMYSRFAQHTRLANIEKPLVTWHSHTTSTSAQNETEQGHQQEAFKRENFRWIMNWDTLAEDTWSAWKKFVYPNRSNSPLTLTEVRELARVLPVITANFYAAYAHSEGSEVKRHRRVTLLAWSRHAVGLSYKPGTVLGFSSRFSLIKMGFRLLSCILLPARATRRREDRALKGPLLNSVTKLNKTS